jgi:hypothetical protein
MLAAQAVLQILGSVEMLAAQAVLQILVYILLDSTYSTDAATCDRDISSPSFMEECTATGTTPFAAGNYYKAVEGSKRLSLNLMTEHIDTGLDSSNRGLC